MSVGGQRLYRYVGDCEFLRLSPYVNFVVTNAQCFAIRPARLAIGNALLRLTFGGICRTVSTGLKVPMGLTSVTSRFAIPITVLRNVNFGRRLYVVTRSSVNKEHPEATNWHVEPS